MGGKSAILNFGGMGVFADLGVFAGVYGIFLSIIGEHWFKEWFGAK